MFAEVQQWFPWSEETQGLRGIYSAPTNRAVRRLQKWILCNAAQGKSRYCVPVRYFSDSGLVFNDLNAILPGQRMELCVWTAWLQRAPLNNSPLHAAGVWKNIVYPKYKPQSLVSGAKCRLFLSYGLAVNQYRGGLRVCVLYIGQAFRYSPENAFYIFNLQIYFIIWYLLDRASLI